MTCQQISINHIYFGKRKANLNLKICLTKIDQAVIKFPAIFPRKLSVKSGNFIDTFTNTKSEKFSCEMKEVAIPKNVSISDQFMKGCT